MGICSVGLVYIDSFMCTPILKECPVCKGEVTEMNTTPIYGQGKGDADPTADNESNLKEKVSSPPKIIVPPIYDFLQAWHSNLGSVAKLFHRC